MIWDGGEQEMILLIPSETDETFGIWRSGGRGTIRDVSAASNHSHTLLLLLVMGMVVVVMMMMDSKTRQRHCTIVHP